MTSPEYFLVIPTGHPVSLPRRGSCTVTTYWFLDIYFLGTGNGQRDYVTTIPEGKWWWTEWQDEEGAGMKEASLEDEPSFKRTFGAGRTDIVIDEGTFGGWVLCWSVDVGGISPSLWWEEEGRKKSRKSKVPLSSFFPSNLSICWFYFPFF